MELTWLACELKSGLVVGELPLAVDNVRRIIAREETTSWSLPLADDSCPDHWYDITAPGFNMIVLCIDDIPTQGWAITSRVVGGENATIGGVTLEHCLARTNVVDVSDEADEVVLLQQIVAPAATAFGFYVDAVPGGPVGVADYYAEEDMSVLQALRDRLELEGAPEWRIALVRRFSTIQKHIQIRSRIGEVRPNAVFDLDPDGRGSIARYTRTTDYGPDGGATVVTGVSDGSGAARPMTVPQVSPLVGAGWPTWAARPSFPNIDAASVDDEDAELLRLATATLRKRERGSVAWAVTGDDTAPRPGIDFTEGDTVQLVVAPQGKRDPVGGTAAVRVLGWDLQPHSGEVTVIVWEEED